jgi:hypothetical protein
MQQCNAFALQFLKGDISFLNYCHIVTEERAVTRLRHRKLLISVTIVIEIIYTTVGAEKRHLLY